MLELKNVTKSYRDVLALDHVCFTLEEGIYALLGPNGAGKSTLMGVLTRQLKLQEGEVLWDQVAIHELKEAYFDLLGYAPQQQGLYDEFSGERFLTYMAILKNIKKSKIKEEVDRVAHMVNMQEHLKKKCKTYSGGMKQRILVAQALLGNPKLLLFDEPTAGLDPKERVSLRNIFASLAQNHILLIATHVVSDVQSIAKEIIFLKQGQIIAHGSVAHMIAQVEAANTLEEVYLQLFDTRGQTL